jgi:hypothetical protein
MVNESLKDTSDRRGTVLDRERYDSSVASFPQGTLFCTAWWLDAVAPGQWGEVTVEKGGQLFARLPYVKKSRGFTSLTMPPLTQTLGPWLRPYSGKYTNRLSEEKKLMTELIERLPPFDLFLQNFHYSITNWLPFYWKGFQQTTRYTYVIEDLDDLDKVWANMDSKTRNIIRKAEKLGIVVEDSDDIETFLDLNEMTFRRQGLALPYSRDFVHRLNAACVENEARKLYIVYGQDGQPHTGLFCVYDKNAMYYLMVGGDPDLRSSGANYLATWESIKFASKVSKVYDFEGSMIESVEHFFRSFGAKQKLYFQVRKTNSLLLKMRQDVPTWLRLWRGR